MDNEAFFWFRATSVIGENCSSLGKIRKQSWATPEMWVLQIFQIFQSNLFCGPTFKVIDHAIIKRCCQDPQNKQSRGEKKIRIKNSEVSYQQSPTSSSSLGWGDVTQMLSPVGDGDAARCTYLRLSHLIYGSRISHGGFFMCRSAQGLRYLTELTERPLLFGNWLYFLR